MYYQSYDAEEALIEVSCTRLVGGYRVLVQGLQQQDGTVKPVRSLVLSPGGTVMKVFPGDIKGKQARRFVHRVRRRVIWVPSNRIIFTASGYAVVSEWCIECDGKLTPIGGRVTVLYGPGNKLIKIIDGEVSDAQAERLIFEQVMENQLKQKPPISTPGQSHGMM